MAQADWQLKEQQKATQKKQAYGVAEAAKAKLQGIQGAGQAGMAAIDQGTTAGRQQMRRAAQETLAGAQAAAPGSGMGSIYGAMRQGSMDLQGGLGAFEAQQAQNKAGFGLNLASQTGEAGVDAAGQMFEAGKFEGEQATLSEERNKQISEEIEPAIKAEIAKFADDWYGEQENSAKAVEKLALRYKDDPEIYAYIMKQAQNLKNGSYDI